MAVEGGKRATQVIETGCPGNPACWRRCPSGGFGRAGCCRVTQRSCGFSRSASWLVLPYSGSFKDNPVANMHLNLISSLQNQHQTPKLIYLANGMVRRSEKTVAEAAQEPAAIDVQPADVQAHS